MELKYEKGVTFWPTLNSSWRIKWSVGLQLAYRVVDVCTASSKLRSWVGYKSTAAVDRPSMFSSTASGCTAGGGVVGVVVQRQQTPVTATTTTTTARTSQLHRSVTTCVNSSELQPLLFTYCFRWRFGNRWYLFCSPLDVAATNNLS